MRKKLTFTYVIQTAAITVWLDTNQRILKDKLTIKIVIWSGSSINENKRNFVIVGKSLVYSKKKGVNLSL